MLLDVGFTAASSYTLDCITCRLLTFDLAALTDGFQPLESFTAKTPMTATAAEPNFVPIDSNGMNATTLVGTVVCQSGVA